MPVVGAIEPMSLPIGPPADVRLHVFGSGFEPTSMIRFGVPLERTDYHSSTEVSTIITRGLFPSPDPAVPVSVRNADSTESNVVTFAFVAIPAMPPDGSIVADLPTLKRFIGARSGQDDVLLAEMLAAATEWWYERVYPDQRGHPDVQLGIVMRASRLYKRRQSPEGQAGWAGIETIQAMAVGDPDESELLENHRDWSKVGIG